MKKVILVLADCGDGSSNINWFRETDIDALERLAKEDPNTWSSGEGLQYQELYFPDGFDLDYFAKANSIYWADNTIDIDVRDYE